MPKPLVVGLAILTMVVSAIFLIREKPVWDLERLLSDVTINNLKISGQTYSVRNGLVVQNVDYGVRLKVLRLAAFYQWNKEDPIFDSPDFDPNSLILSLKALESTQVQLLKVISQTEPLFPTQFLKSVVNVSLKNRAFAANPSDANAMDLLKSQEESAKLYGQSAENFRIFLGHPSGVFLTMFNTRTSDQIVSEDYDLIVKNSEQLQTEIEKRVGCLNGSGKCVRPLSNLAKPSGENSQQQTNLLSKDMIKRELFGGSDNFTLAGPFRAQTPCFGWGENFSLPERAFYLAQVPSSDRSMGLSYFDVPVADEAYFRKIPLKSSSPTDQFLLSEGHPYTLQHSAAPYMCFDDSYTDQVAELESFLETKKPLLQNLNIDPEAKKAERNLFEDPDPSYPELAYLAEWYGYIYSQGEQKRIDSELLNHYLDIRGQLAGFDKLVARMVPYTLGITHNLQLDPALEQSWLQTVYLSRDNYNLMYLAFSPSVWRLSELPQYMERRQISGAIGPGGGYLDYTEAVKLYSAEVVNSWFVDGDSISSSLLKNNSK